MDYGRTARDSKPTVDHRSSSPIGFSAKSRLTPFEIYVVQLMAAGLRRGEIARKLHRSPQTVSNLLTKAKDKLGARTVAEAIALVSERKRDLA